MIQRYSRQSSSDGAPLGKAVEDCMRAIIGVLLNLTHDNGEAAGRGSFLSAALAFLLMCAVALQSGAAPRRASRTL